MKHIKLIIFLVVFATQANATVYYVSPDGTGTDGLSWATAFPTLLAAQANAVSPAEIWVKQGTYNVTDTTLTIYSGKNVYGGFLGNESTLAARNPNPALTILNGNKKRRVLNAATGIAVETIWDGFTIQNGYAGNAGGVSLQKNTTLKNCIIQNNKNATNNGGGVYMACNATDSVKLINCTVKNNIVYYNGLSSDPVGGGGIFVYAGSSAAIIRGCTIQDNTVDAETFSSAKMYGGGVFMNDGSIENCSVIRNRSTSIDPGTLLVKTVGAANAGGIFVMPGVTTANILLKNCKITGNTAEVSQGGGLMINTYWTGTSVAAKVRVVNCTISNNYSRTHGGGVLCDSQNASSTAEYTFENCVIANNLTETQQGGGVFINNKTPSVVKFTNCTVVKNRMNTYNYGGAGIFYNNIAADITNCVFWGNLNAGTAPLKHHVRTSSATGNMLTYCAFDSKFKDTDVSPVGNEADLSGKVALAQANTGVDSLYVMFVSPTNFTGKAKTSADSLSLNEAKWAIAPTSACVDAGATVRTLTSDIIGTTRPFGSGYDIGAYEYDPNAILAVSQNIDSKSIVYGTQGAVVINNLDHLKQVTVYTLMGTIVKMANLSEGLNSVALPANQLYIVKIGNNAKKVLVK
jgi:hypothetical protein